MVVFNHIETVCDWISASYGVVLKNDAGNGDYLKHFGNVIPTETSMKSMT